MSTRFAAALGVAWLAAAWLAGPAAAHEGHEHAAAPPLPSAIAPRGEAFSDAFELVAVSRGGTLTLHLDRFRTNEPVPDARIEIRRRRAPARRFRQGRGPTRCPRPGSPSPAATTFSPRSAPARPSMS